MKNRRIPILAVLLFCLIVVFISGCGASGKAAGVTTFELHEDGTITHTIIEDYTDSFSEEELTAYITEQVNSYVKNKEEPEISLNSCSIDTGSGKITVEMSYASVSDYSAFNNVRAFSGWLQDAYKNGCDFSNGFVTNTGTFLPGYILPVEYPDLSVLVVQEPMNIVMPQSAILYSDNITANSDGTYTVLKDQNDAVPEVFQTVNNNAAYLIYSPKSK